MAESTGRKPESADIHPAAAAPAATDAPPCDLSVLVVDDERNIRSTLALCLENIGCRVATASTPSAALDALERERADLVFLDLRLGSESGLDLLPRLLAVQADLSVVIVTAYGTIETAVEAMKRGAVDYLAKPFTPAEVRHVALQVAERRSLVRRLGALESALADAVPEVDLRTRSPAMLEALEVVTRAAASDAAVLLRGESGTGKGVVAQALHAQSRRRARPFVTVSAPTLTDELLASELFGHAKGAFTGAIRDQPGRVEAAQGGTLFLDEIGEMSPTIQAKLLRFLQEKRFERVGESQTRRADVRVVTATNRDLESEVAAGRFREDLLFRLNVIEVRLPALRERAEDILALATGFLAFFARALGRAVPVLAPEAQNAILSYPWPGNLRELRNVVERAVILWPGAILGVEALPERVASSTRRVPRLGGDFSLEEIEREHLERVLARAGTLDEAARILEVDPSTLWRKRKKLEAP